ncbi:MAG: type II toxin-antitoxin system RelE/ParE family toxin [Chloroflexota bacterium]
MASVLVAERARSELERLIHTRRLPADTRDRVRRSLAQLETFPLAGRRLTGRWRAFRLIVGPWPWLLLVHIYDGAAGTVTVVAVHDAKTAA